RSRCRWRCIVGSFRGNAPRRSAATARRPGRAPCRGGIRVAFPSMSRKKGGVLAHAPIRSESVAHCNPGAPVASRGALKVTPIALVHDDRASVLAIEEVVDAAEGVDLPGTMQPAVAAADAGHEIGG